ncbi:MAG TPA: methylenetetrahydrofolate--tRNA-(uracil(54)-C(5))-methyltransferase (FADH(2)-oxidizing) TrmFO, partial [Deltaproteobacteria bacterium]|nr:methylenetetrahydrofolate--tRNA-(uracil(54)-C(5))-methyltransferase (FADH(2)-oxidizing) TrmFO [Deltaproteobacteria bacterium]
QLNLKSHPNVFFAGQITGVEGYMESTAMGILAARQIAASLENRVESPP